MAKGKSKEIDPLGRDLKLMAPYACVNFIADAPPLLSAEPIGYWAHDRANKSQHPNKENPGGSFRYFGGE